ncbi:MAG: inosine/xanthosine triphosphatase [Halodesulfurarchaeum sp.]
MYVAVGSGNPVKVAATEGAIGDIATHIEAVPVDSGVSEQPRSDRETLRGAENRAQRALEEGDFDLSVGIEGGVATPTQTEGLYLTMWAAATDGTTHGRGAGPRLRLPESIASRVESGEELGPLMDDVLGTSGVAENQGAAGVLTDNIITRESALRHAVAGALGPFVSPYY